MLFVDGHAPGLKLGDAVAINVSADDLVPRLGQAGSRDESNVPTSNDGKVQKKSLLEREVNTLLEFYWYCERCKKKKKAIRFLARPKKPRRPGQLGPIPFPDS